MQQGWGLRPGRIALPKAVRVRGMTSARLEKVGGPTLGVVESGRASPTGINGCTACAKRATKPRNAFRGRIRDQSAVRSVWAGVRRAFDFATAGAGSNVRDDLPARDGHRYHSIPCRVRRFCRRLFVNPRLPALIGRHRCGPGHPLLVIAGPCVIESEELCLRIGDALARIAGDLGVQVVFKASYDKANRTSVASFRGPGIDDGLAVLERVRAATGLPVTTDVHLPEQATAAGQVCDMLQIPAFLCRQTDLLAAAAATGRAVNVKKGQFMSVPEMRNALEKLREGGATRSMLTERGTFFGFNRLVNDFIGVGDMIELGREFGAPVCFDATHSMQLPGGEKTATGGRPDRCAQVARAAVAVGVDAIFLECHPNPAKSSSDASTIQPLSAVREILTSLVAIQRALVSATA